MEVSDARRLKRLDDENRWVKKLLADAMLHASTLREARGKLLTPRAGWNVVTWAIEQKGYAQRRACGLIGMKPKTYRYGSSRPEMPASEHAYGHSRRTAVALAIGGCTSCCGARE